MKIHILKMIMNTVNENIVMNIVIKSTEIGDLVVEVPSVIIAITTMIVEKIMTNLKRKIGRKKNHLIIR